MTQATAVQPITSTRLHVGKRLRVREHPCDSSIGTIREITQVQERGVFYRVLKPSPFLVGARYFMAFANMAPIGDAALAYRIDTGMIVCELLP